MGSRLELHEVLCSILGSRNVYYQAPPTVMMKYPCIRYSKKGNSTAHADNKPYKVVNRYDGVVIDYDPDSTIADRLHMKVEMCTLDPGYAADNLNHFPFTIYY